MSLILPDELHLPPLHSQDSGTELTTYGRLRCIESRIVWFVVIKEKGAN